MNWAVIRKITLTFLFILSLYLSFVLWRNPGGNVSQPENTDTPVVSSVTFDRSLASVFGPTEIVEHNGQGSFLTKDTEVAKKLYTIFSEAEITDLTDPESLDGENYLNRIKQTEGVEFIYPSSIPFDLYENSFSSLPREYENRTFNRVYIPLTDPERAYFYNTHSQLYYTAEVADMDTQMLSTILNEEVQTFAVQSVELNDHIVYLPFESLELPVLSYMVEEQPNSLFIERLFNDTSEIQTIVSENASRYYDYFSELIIDNAKDILTYSRPQASADNLSLAERVKNSFDKMIQFEHWPNEIYFYGLSSAENETEFRRYINGFPIFGSPDYGGTFITVSENGIIDLKMPTIVAQTPISNNEATVKMDSLQELIVSLNSAGYNLTSIEDIKIGYTWDYSDESSRVVTLTPNWYAKKDGRWVSVQSLIGLSQGGAGDGL